MPQLGVEYSLEPTEEQQKIYRQMIDLGADIIFGGHPHVAEPTEIIEKTARKIYSLFNGKFAIQSTLRNSQQLLDRARGHSRVELTKEGDRTF